MTTKEPESKVTEKLFTPRDLVYGGRRRSSNFIVIEVFPIGDDGKLGEGMLFDFKSKEYRALSVGGVYTGAEFSGGTIKNFNKLTFKKRYTDEKRVLAWQAVDTGTEALVRAKTRETGDKRDKLIADVLLPLRMIYSEMANRGDYSGMEALRIGVGVELTRRVPKKD